MATVERPKAGELEERTVSDTLAVEGKKIRGRIPYSVESRAMPGGWREVIEPGALKNAKFDRLLATVNHGGGSSLPIGRYPNTLELEDRADGMHWSVDPPLSRADVREAVERGDLNEGSWRMVVGKEEWRGDVRHVLEIAELKDVCVAVDPAVYPQAQVEYRTQPVTQEEVEMDNARSAGGWSRCVHPGAARRRVEDEAARRLAEGRGAG
jgi:HK97 family phage prohead protease